MELFIVALCLAVVSMGATALALWRDIRKEQRRERLAEEIEQYLEAASQGQEH